MKNLFVLLALVGMGAFMAGCGAEEAKQPVKATPAPATGPKMGETPAPKEKEGDKDKDMEDGDKDKDGDKDADKDGDKDGDKDADKDGDKDGDKKDGDTEKKDE